MKPAVPCRHGDEDAGDSESGDGGAVSGWVHGRIWGSKDFISDQSPLSLPPLSGVAGGEPATKMKGESGNGLVGFSWAACLDLYWAHLLSSPNKVHSIEFTADVIDLYRF